MYYLPLERKIIKHLPYVNPNFIHHTKTCHSNNKTSSIKLLHPKSCHSSTKFSSIQSVSSESFSIHPSFFIHPKCTSSSIMSFIYHFSSLSGSGVQKTGGGSYKGELGGGGVFENTPPSVVAGSFDPPPPPPPTPVSLCGACSAAPAGSAEYASRKRPVTWPGSILFVLRSVPDLYPFQPPLLPPGGRILSVSQDV